MACALRSCCRGSNSTRPSSSSSAAVCLVLIKITIVGVALLGLLSFCTVVAIDGDEFTAAAAGQDGLLRVAGELSSGMMVPSYDSMASLQQALSHSSWGDGSETGVGRLLLGRRKKDADDEDEDEDDDEQEDDDDADDEDDDDDDDDDDDSDDEDDGKKKKQKKKKKKGVRSKTTALLGVQLDMSMLTSGGASDDEEDDDEDEDDDGRRRRHLLAKPADSSPPPAPSPSKPLLTWASTSPLFPDGWLWCIGKLPRSEAEAGCTNVAGGKVEFNIDLKKMLQEKGVDDGDDVSPLKVVHHLNCVTPDAKDKSKMVVDPKLKTGHFFVAVQIKKVAAAVDCAAGAAECIVFGPKTMLPPEAIQQIMAKKAKGKRKLLMGKPGVGIQEEALAKVKRADVVKVESDAGRTDGKQVVKDAQKIIKQGTEVYKSEVAKPEQEWRGVYEGAHPKIKSDEPAQVLVSRASESPTQINLYFTVTWMENGEQKQEKAEVLKDKATHCFPAAAQVLLSNGALATMQQLRHGDRVLTVLPGGQLGFSEVYLFGHKDPDAHANYVALQTEINATLHATADHYIHIIPRSKAAAGMPLSWKDAVHTRAGKVQPGDVMIHVSWDHCASLSGIIASHKGSSCGSMQYVKITSAKMQVAKGLYNPYTLVGNIVVDGYSASSHSGLEFLDPLTGTGPYVPYLHQVMLAPVRLIHRLYPSLMAYVDQQYSRDAWASAGVAKVVRSVAQYHLVK